MSAFGGELVPKVLTPLSKMPPPFSNFCFPTLFFYSFPTQCPINHGSLSNTATSPTLSSWKYLLPATNHSHFKFIGYSHFRGREIKLTFSPPYLTSLYSKRKVWTMELQSIETCKKFTLVVGANAIDIQWIFAWNISNK